MWLSRLDMSEQEIPWCQLNLLAGCQIWLLQTICRYSRRQGGSQWEGGGGEMLKLILISSTPHPKHYICSVNFHGLATYILPTLGIGCSCLLAIARPHLVLKQSHSLQYWYTFIFVAKMLTDIMWPLKLDDKIHELVSSTSSSLRLIT